MKKVYLILFFLFFGITSIFAQAIFRSNVATGNWNVAGSWIIVSGVDGDGIPDVDDEVFIQDGHAITLIANEACLNLHLSGGTTSSGFGIGGIVTIDANILEINGFLRNYWAIIGETPILGIQDLASGISATQLTTTTGKLSIVGNTRNLTYTGAWGPFHTGVDVEFNLNANQIASLGTVFKARNISLITGVLDAGANRLSPDDGSGFSQGNVTINSGATLISARSGGGIGSVIARNGSATGSGGTFTLSGTLKVSGNSPQIEMVTIIINPGSTIEYNGVNQTFIGTTTALGALLLNYFNLTLSNSGIKTTHVAFTTTINGTLSLQGTSSVALGGGATLAYGASGILEYKGSAIQTTGATPVEWPISNGPFSLIINNANGVTLNATGGRSINGALILSNGILTTSAASLLTMGASSTIPITPTNASFINGPLSKIGNANFTFPIGKTNCGPSGTVNGYAPLAIATFTGGFPTDQFTAEYIRLSAYSIGTNATGVNHISRCDYWTLTRDGGTLSTVDITLYWDDPINNCVTTAPYINSLATLTVVHNNNSGGNWDAMGSIGGFGSNATGFVPWTGTQSTTFGAFAIASTDFNNPLPISINYFTGIKQNSGHLLNWKITCNSSPFANIEMERSTDNRNYKSIYSIYATALRCQQPFDHTDTNPAAGINYYRLKMTDPNGKIAYSTVVSLLNAAKGIDILNIAPNPIVGGSFDLKISAAQNTPIDIIITDMQGRVMLKKAVSMVAGFNSIPVNVARLTAGTYQLYGNTADGRSRVLRFVVQ